MTDAAAALKHSPRTSTRPGRRFRQVWPNTVLRLIGLVGVNYVCYALTPPSTDPVGAGLVAMAIITGVASAWSFIDGWRQPLHFSAMTWSLSIALFVVLEPLPYALSWPAAEGGWSGPLTYLHVALDDGVFNACSVGLPAAAGLALGRLAGRPTQRQNKK